MIGSVTSLTASRYRQLYGKWGSDSFIPSPSALAGLVAWYDASDIASVTIGTGGVSNWADKSGLGSRDLAQATEASRPAYSAATKTLTFDGTNDSLKTAAFTLGQPTTVYFVGSQVTWTNGEILYDGNSTTERNILAQFSSSPNIELAPNDTALNGGLAIGVLGLVSAVFNGASSSLRVNYGVPTTGNPGSQSSNGFTLGAAFGGGSNANITVNEIAIYNVAHTASQQQQFWQYAQRKWGIAP